MRRLARKVVEQYWKEAGNPRDREAASFMFWLAGMCFFLSGYFVAGLVIAIGS